jgi:hypothetical protein
MNVEVAVQFVQLPYDVYRDVIEAIETLSDALYDLVRATEDRASFKKKERKTILACCEEAVNFARTAAYIGLCEKRRTLFFLFVLLVFYFSLCSTLFI